MTNDKMQMSKLKVQNKLCPRLSAVSPQLIADSRWLIYNLYLFLILYFGICSPLLFAQGTEEEPVVVNGDKVEYLEDLHQAIGIGHVVITYQDMKLTCDRIVVFVDSKDVYAEGNVILSQDGDSFSGERMNYNFDSKRGTAIDTQADVDPWYGGGEHLYKNTDRKFLMHKGYITSCDLKEPHYRIKGNKVLIYLKDRIIIYNAVMVVDKLPILYLPYYSYSLKDNRPNVTVVTGGSKKWGRFALTTWRLFKDELQRGYVRLDRREKRGYAAGFDYFYDTYNFGEGKLRTYFLDDTDKQDEFKNRLRRKRNRLQIKHQWDVATDTKAIAEYHKYTDADVIKDFFYQEEYEVDIVPASYLSVIKTDLDYTLSFYSNQQANHFETVVEKLPELLLDIKNTQLKDTDFYYKSQLGVTHFNREYGGQETDDDVDRLDNYNQISYVKKVLGWLNISPYFGTRETYYSKDINGDSHLVRTTAYSGLDVSTRIYRVFDLKTNFWNLNINKLRHIITPTINYSYINDPSVQSYALTNFDTIDSLGRVNTATLSLENKLQTKQGANNVDLATFILSTDYDFTARQRTNFTTVRGDLELRPYPWLLIESDAVYNTRIGGFDTINEDLVIDKGEKWTFGLGNRFQRDTSDELTLDVMYKINPKWTISAYERYYFKKMATGIKTATELKEQEYTLTRDLHCWWLDLTYNLTGGEGGTFWVIFRLKEFPEIPLAIKSRYRPPKKKTDEEIELENKKSGNNLP